MSGRRLPKSPKVPRVKIENQTLNHKAHEGNTKEWDRHNPTQQARTGLAGDCGVSGLDLGRGTGAGGDGNGTESLSGEVRRRTKMR